MIQVSDSSTHREMSQARELHMKSLTHAWALKVEAGNSTDRVIYT